MRGLTAWIALSMISLAFAGCSDGGSSSVDASDQDLGVDVQDTKDGLGAIVGVVVDGSITPVAGATIVLTDQELETQTNENGAFAFKDLEPGPYFIKASKPGYAEVQQSVDVQADVKEPPIVKVLLERVPGTEPFFMVDNWVGFIECSVRAGTGGNAGSVGFNACSVDYVRDLTNQDAEHPIVIDQQPDFFQSEMIWESTQTLGSGLSLVAGPEDCRDVKYGRYDGPSPAVLPLDGEKLAAENVGGEGAGICVRVFTFTSEETAHLAGVVTSQEFQVITHHTYNFVPPEGWLFFEDGEPPVPQ